MISILQFKGNNFLQFGVGVGIGLGEDPPPAAVAVAEYSLAWGAFPCHPSFGLDHLKRKESEISPLAASTAPCSPGGALGSVGRLLPAGKAQPNLLGPHLVNSALVLTYFLGEKIEYRFKCSGALENHRPSSVRK